MTDLFTIRDACDEDLATLNAYNYNEGMDAFPSVENIRDAVNGAGEIVGYLRLAFSPEGIAHVNPVVTYPTWRGYGVGRALIETIEHDPMFFSAPRVVIPASINALHFYQGLGYTFAPGGDQLDEEQLYCLEKFPQHSA